ncbi:hypothetical protein CgunFtcFv8_023850 [Champsocephalus gunnari]|uniref:Uncharacterized protein n=1 Tax=Champsocephalus gunnari TaxID=52237 RepID=A0AAN8DBR9_CHAGU|nr:hypothetical protein CgunFtcFv8_023850 [Champsocephalus gunnari]
MWTAAGGGRGGWIHVWATVGRKGVTFLFVSHYGMAAAVEICTGSDGVIPSYHHIHSCWGWAGKKSPMMYTPQACWTWS